MASLRYREGSRDERKKRLSRISTNEKRRGKRMREKLVTNLGLIFAIGGVFIFSFAVLVSLPVKLDFAPARNYHHSLAIAPLSTHEQVLIAAYRHGWTGEQWTCLRRLIDLENRSWSVTSKNTQSTASGIFQVIKSPSGAMFSNYTVEQQSELGARYIEARYQTPCRALRFHFSHGYF
jgi:hypothetical protein